MADTEGGADVAQSSCSIQGCEKAHHARGWCHEHYERWRLFGGPTLRPQRPSVAARFWSKVDKDGPVPEHAPELGACWVWLAGTFRGYGRFRSVGSTMQAYRWAYVDAYGQPPIGMDVHHRCRNPACVRPGHLEALTPEEHGTLNAWGRKTHCPHGHPYTPENTRLNGGGGRSCRACGREQCRQYYQRRKARERSGVTG